MNALNTRAWRPCPFATYDYMRTHWELDEFFAPSDQRECLLLAAFRDKILIGYLPLRKVRQRALGLPFTKIELMLTHDSDRPHVVATANDAEACTRAFFEFLQNEEPGWHFLELGDQDRSSHLFAPRLDGYVRHFNNTPNGTIHIRWPDMPSYFKEVPRRFRTNISRNVRMLLQSGDIEYVWSDDPGAVSQMLDHFIGVERRSWKAKANGTIDRHPKRVQFFRSLISVDQPMRMSIGLVVKDGLPIAGVLNGRYAARLFALQISFDESYSDLGPGQLLVFMSVREAIERGDAELNMLHGSAHYKERWLATITETKNIQVYRIGTPPYVKAKLGDLRRWLQKKTAENEDANYNPAKRKIEMPANDDIDRESLRDAFSAFLATNPAVVRFTKTQLTRIMPFRMNVERDKSAAEVEPGGTVAPLSQGSVEESPGS